MPIRQPLLFFVLIGLLLSACAGRPGDAVVRKELEARLHKEGLDALFRLENLQRLNGYALDDNRYVVQVKYDLVFTRDYADLAQEAKQTANDAPLAGFMGAMTLLALQMQYGNFKAGERITREADLTFVRSEKGWRLLKTDGADT